MLVADPLGGGDTQDMRYGLLCLVVALRLDAQEWRVTPFLGYAQHSPVGTSWGLAPDWSHQMVGLHTETPVLRFVWGTVSYAPVFAAARLAHESNGATVAAGFAPFGLKARTGPVYVATAIGGLFSAHRIPTHESGRHFNVTLEWGGGVEIRRVQVGYKFHHFSNAGSRRSNPGVDADLFYVGWRVH